MTYPEYLKWQADYLHPRMHEIISSLGSEPSTLPDLKSVMRRAAKELIAEGHTFGGNAILKDLEC